MPGEGFVEEIWTGKADSHHDTEKVHSHHGDVTEARRTHHGVDHIEWASVDGRDALEGPLPRDRAERYHGLDKEHQPQHLTRVERSIECAQCVEQGDEQDGRLVEQAERKH